jgi:hypothetical protein
MKIQVKSLFFCLLIISTAISFTSCNSNNVPENKKNSPFTQGNVQLNLKKDVTTQAEVLDKFGPPNVMTIDSNGNEVWTYQKNAMITRSKKSGFYGSIILAGGDSSTAGFEQTVKSMTLIIKFDKSKKLIDFKSMSTEF